MAAVAIGVAAVLLLTSLGESARAYVTNQFAGIGSNLLITIPGKIETTGSAPMAAGGTQDLTLEDAEAIRRQVPQVNDVAPVSVGISLAKYQGLSRSITLIGTTPNFLRLRNLEVAVGSNLPDMDPRNTAQVCVIGAKLQEELFRGESALGKMIRFGDFRYRVIGILARTGTSLGVDLDEIAIMPVANVQKMVNREGLFRIIIEIGNIQSIDKAEIRIRELLIERHDDNEDFTLISQGSVVSSLDDILIMLTMALTAIAAISLAVAGIGIINVMLISVAEPTPEVGLMKAVGASRGHIIQVFLAEAAVLSLLGGVIGVAIGMLGNQAIHLAVPAMPIHTPIWAIEASLAVALGVGLLFGVIPAVKASRLPPVDALRKGI
jgi:putative ABC transport system permease protein